MLKILIVVFIANFLVKLIPVFAIPYRRFSDKILSARYGIQFVDVEFVRHDFVWVVIVSFDDIIKNLCEHLRIFDLVVVVKQLKSVWITGDTFVYLFCQIHIIYSSE